MERRTGQEIAVRTSGSDLTLTEIRDKFHRYGIRQFAFYEDRFSIKRDHFWTILEGIVNNPNLRGNVHLHAPEGIQVQLIDASLAQLMRQAGFERIYTCRWRTPTPRGSSLGTARTPMCRCLAGSAELRCRSLTRSLRLN